MKVLIVVTLTFALATAYNFNLIESEIVPSGRILKGDDADDGQFPYIVSLAIKYKHINGKYAQCSGCLISDKWILTVAHCLRHADQVIVSLGATVLSNPIKKIHVWAKNIIIQEEYGVGKKGNGLGLIKIPPVGVMRSIRAISLPENVDNKYSGKKGLVAGWLPTASKNSHTEILKWGRMEVLSNEECEKNHKGAVCARINTKGIDGITICAGDAGGPLVLESNPKVLIGVAYLADKPKAGCDSRASFINVQAHLDWIKRITK